MYSELSDIIPAVLYIPMFIIVGTNTLFYIILINKIDPLIRELIYIRRELSSLCHEFHKHTIDDNDRNLRHTLEISELRIFVNKELEDIGEEITEILEEIKKVKTILDNK